LLANCRSCQVRRLHFCIFYGEKREQMQNFERIFDMHQPPFKADSLDAMEYSILGFFKAEDSSRPQLERISDHEIKVSIDERKAQKAQKQFDKAVEHSNAHKFNSARFALREAIGLWPYNSEYHRLLAQVTMEGGDLEKAQDSCLDALLLDDKNLWALLLMGNILSAKGNTEAADGYFSKILQYHPDNALALNNLGGIYCKQGKYAKGKELFEKSLSIDPENLNPYYGMALRGAVQYWSETKKHQSFADWLESNAEESMTYFDFNEGWWRRIRTSNCVERLNKEIKKRTKVVGVFPNPESCERLIGSLLMEQHEEWMEEKAYLTEKEMEKSAFCA